jgi:16S rRNA (cytosine967-C5)-methyltransferase
LQHSDWCGFLNAVLRGVSQLLTEEQTSAPAANAVPLSDGRFRKLSSPLFADPSANRAEYFRQAFSFPDWLVDRWSKRYDFAELCRLGFWFNAPPRLTLRVNSLRTGRAAFLDALQAAGIDAAPGVHRASVLLSGSVRIEDLPGYQEGWFLVQDESAMQAAELLAPQPGWNVLDLCAAPGSKTTHLAELMHNEGTILAADVDPQRLERIAENSRRLGATIIEPRLVSADGSNIPPGPFDAILVDVPCSNTGVLGKRPEVRWRLSPRDLVELPRMQARLLQAALERLKPGGRLVYSTCSIEPEENAEMVRRVLSSVAASGPVPIRPIPISSVQIRDEQHPVPGRPADGGYQALLVREA